MSSIQTSFHQNLKLQPKSHKSFLHIVCIIFETLDIIMSTAQVASPPPPPQGAAGAYQARRSNKTARTNVQSDGAVWKERLAVCEAVTDEGNPKLTIRSYYRNQQTQQKVWDEPPSGASEIIFASSEQRKKADLQKREMQLTLDQLPPDAFSSKSNGNNNEAASDTKKKGRFGLFKKKERPFLADDSKDLNLQRAIALSVAEANGKTPYDSDPVILYDTEPFRPQKSDDEDVALAKALSMSEEKLQPTGMTEEELLQQALEASRLEAKRVPTFDPYAPGTHDNSAFSRARQHSSSSSSDIEPPHKMDSDEGKKKPGRSMKRRVFGGRKTIANKAGVV